MQAEKLTGLGFDESFANELLGEIDEEFYAALTDGSLYDIYACSIKALKQLGFDDDMIIELWCDYEGAFTIGADTLKKRLEELREAVGECWLDVLTEEFEDYGESRCFELLSKLPTDKQWSKYVSQL